MNHLSKEQFALFSQQLQELTSTDEVFRAELLQDPTAAFEKMTGQKMPEDFKVRAVEDRANGIKFVDHDPSYTTTLLIPPIELGQLDDDALESVAGGIGDGRFEVVSVGLDGFEVVGGIDGEYSADKCCCCCCCANFGC